MVNMTSGGNEGPLNDRGDQEEGTSLYSSFLDCNGDGFFFDFVSGATTAIAAGASLRVSGCFGSLRTGSGSVLGAGDGGFSCFVSFSLTGVGLRSGDCSFGFGVGVRTFSFGFGVEVRTTVAVPPITAAVAIVGVTLLLESLSWVSFFVGDGVFCTSFCGVGDRFLFTTAPPTKPPTKAAPTGASPGEDDLEPIGVYTVRVRAGLDRRFVCSGLGVFSDLTARVAATR